jgi:hypothetical protein
MTKDDDAKTDEALTAANELSEVMHEELGTGPDAEVEDAGAAEDKVEAQASAETVVDEKSDEKKTEIPQVDDSLLERAVKVGIPLSKAKGFTSENLEAAVQAAEAVKTAPAVAAAEEDEKPENFDDLKEDGFDERLIGRLNKMAGRLQDLAAENKSLKESHAQLAATSSGQSTERAEKFFDGQISSLGEDFEPIFGKGGFGSLERGSEVFKQRAAVLEEVGALAAGYKAVNKPVPNIDTLFSRAVFNVTGKTASPKAAVVEDPIPGKLKAQATKTVGRPASTNKQNTPAGELNQALQQLEESLGR